MKKSNIYIIRIFIIGAAFILLQYFIDHPESFDHIKVFFETIHKNYYGLVENFNMLGSVFCGAALGSWISPVIHKTIVDLIRLDKIHLIIKYMIFAIIFLLICWGLGSLGNIVSIFDFLVILFTTFCTCLLTECIGVQREEEDNQDRKTS